MANKTLTAKVNLNISDVEHKVKKLNTLFNSINNNINKASGGNTLENTTNRATKSLTEYDKAAQRLAANQEKIHRKEYENWWKTALSQQDAINKELKLERVRQRSIKTLGNGDKAARRVAQATEQIRRKEYEAWWQAQLLNQEYQKAHPILSRLPAKVQEWWKKQQQVKSATRETRSALDSVFTKLKQVAAMYISIQGLKTAMDTSDSITSAKNRFNNLDGGSPEKTAESMDKIYAAAQRSRTDYEDMLGNVSKTMTLAGDSFQDNIDNAIRFQEIMAKAYTVGGASDTEAATSMYQLVQALGSGVLQGDELRSVREGAPLAYKAIEKFAQGVYDTDESLKQLAADGKITSEMVVAAIMDADFSGKLEEQFENTQATFEQTFAKIKNMAIKAFEPVLEKINKLLNSKKGERLIKGIGYALVILGNTLYWVIDIFATFFNWCAENWEWLKYVIAGVALVILGILIPAFLKWVAVAIMTAVKNIISFVSQYWGLLLIVAGVMAILYMYELWRQGTITTTEFIVGCLAIIAVAAIITGIALGQMWLIWVGIGIAAVALILMFFEEICYGAAWLGGWIVNILFAIWNTVVYVIQSIASIVAWLFAIIVDILSAIWNVIVYVIQSIASICAWLGAIILNIISSVWNVIVYVTQSVASIFAWLGAIILNIIVTIANLFIGVANIFAASFRVIGAAGYNAFIGILNVGNALGSSMIAIATNIGNVFANAWIFAKNLFWGFIKACLQGLELLVAPLSALSEFCGGGSFSLDGLIGDVDSKIEDYKPFEDVGKAWRDGYTQFKTKNLTTEWNAGMNTVDYLDYVDPNEAFQSTWDSLDELHTGYTDPNEAFSSTWDLVDGLHTGYMNPNDAFQSTWEFTDGLHVDYVDPNQWGETAANWGSDIVDAINEWGSQFQNQDPNQYDGIFSDLTNSIDYDKLLGDNALPNVDDPAYNLDGAWDEPTVDELLSGVDDIKDSMDIADDDLEWMRKIAEMEWRNEFTTAEIKVEMNNNNTVYNDRDLDGIVEYLSDTLRSEMTSVAYGVHY